MQLSPPQSIKYIIIYSLFNCAVQLLPNWEGGREGPGATTLGTTACMDLAGMVRDVRSEDRPYVVHGLDSLTGPHI